MATFKEFVEAANSIIQSIVGLLIALGLFISGIGTLWSNIRGFYKKNVKKEQIPMNKAKGTERFFPIFGAAMIMLSVGILVARAFGDDDRALNVKLTAQAWEAFNKEKYDSAIVFADKCISEFQGAADRNQAELTKDNIPMPKLGKVSDNEKTTIMSRGPLNDVATCFYIKGRGAEFLGEKEKAKQAYIATAKYTYARCWDPAGWFWSPSEAAQDRMAGLEK